MADTIFRGDDAPALRLDALVPHAVELVLAARTLLSPRVVRLQLHALEGQPFEWLPGQYLELLLPGGARRAFSIANAVDADHGIELHVRDAPGSPAVHQLFASFEVGMRVRAHGPLGTFVPRRDSARPMLYVAGGTGIAPIKAIIEHFAALGSRRPIQLYWGVRQIRDLYLEDWLEQRARELPQLSYVPVVSHPGQPLAASTRRGLVVDQVVADHASLAAFDVYLCGPPGMVEAGRRKLAATDLPPQHLFIDSFKYDPGVLASVLAPSQTSWPQGG